MQVQAFQGLHSYVDVVLERILLSGIDGAGWVGYGGGPMADQTASSAPMSPVDYAEQVLGVHEPWTSAQTRLDEYELALKTQALLKGRYKGVQIAIRDREFEVMTETPAKYQNASDTAMRRYVKEEQEQDYRLRQLRSELHQVQLDLDNVEADVLRHSRALDVLTARMTELGGLLQFYAVVKQAQTQAIQQQKEGTAT